MQKNKIFLLSFITSLAFAFTAYSNGSFVGSLVGEKNIGFVFIITSILTIVGLELLPNIVSKFGNKNTGVSLVFITMTSLAVLYFSSNNYLSLIMFIFFNASITFLPFVYDIFLEHNTRSEKVGTIRGFFITLTNIAWLSSPYIAGIIIDKFGFKLIFLISSIILFFGFIFFISAIKFKDLTYKRKSLLQEIKYILKKTNERNSIFINLLMQTFYGFMVIFMPVYLHNHIGFDFKTIGIIFTFMLLPFIILPIPLGKLADKYIGEKELLIIGFFIISLSTFWIGLYTNTTILFWIILLFTTRIGASIIESMNDSFFFKKVSETDTETIGLYRSMSPVGFLIGPIIGTICIYFNHPTYSFIVLSSLIFIIGLGLTYKLHDTK